MIWLRKGLVWLLALLLFFVLLDGVLATSIDIAVGKPAKLESWLNESGLYSSFVTTAIKQVNSSANNGGQSNGVSLSDTVVQQAAEATFTPALIQQDVNTFINSNYTWLEGKTTTPSFTINLASAKQNFAQQVGQDVETYLNNLPVCTRAQALAAANTSDPLQLSCRPSVLNSAAVGAQVAQQLASNSGFLSNTVITAQTFNPNHGSQTQPYYKQFSMAPKIYQIATKAPLIFTAIALLCIGGIIFIAPSKRKGFRRIAYVFAEVGVILICVKIATNVVFNHVEGKLFNNASNGPLQQALTGFAKRLIAQLNTINLYGGITLIILAVIIFVYLIVTRKKRAGHTPIKDDVVSSNLSSSRTEANTPTVPSSTTQKPISDNNKPANPGTPSSTRKRPRLIQ